MSLAAVELGVQHEQPRTALTVVSEPLHVLFVQTEETAGIAQMRQLNGEGVPPYDAWVSRMLGLQTGGLTPDKLTVVNPADGDQLPNLRELQKFDGVFIGGSHHMTTEDVPVVTDTRRFIRDAAEAGNELWVNCFPHQLAHEAFGGKTGDAGALQFGVYDVTLTPAGEADPITRGLGRQHLVFHSNSRRVTEIAPGTSAMPVVELASAPFRGQATRIGETLYTSQHHFDLDGDVMDALAVGKQKAKILQVSEAELPGLIADIRRDAGTAQANSERYAKNWLQTRVKPHRLARTRG